MNVANAKRAPGPKGRPVVGNLPEIRGNRLRFLTRLLQEHGSFARFQVGPLVAHLVTEPEHVRHVLQEKVRNYSKQTRGFEKLRPLLGNGLLTSEGEFWLRQRRIAQPAFHRERIAGFGTLFARVAGELCARWEPLAKENRTVDVLAELMGATLRAVALALFSQEMEDATSEVGQALTVALEWANDSITRVIEVPQAIPTRRNRSIQKAIRTLDGVVNRIITARRASGGGGDDLLGMLMSAKDPESGGSMTDQQLRDEVMTLFLAGHETTANNLAWTLALLSQHPAEARRLHAELDAVLGGRAPTLEDVPKLPFTRRVLDESLRLYPPAWSFGRTAIAADELGGFEIPKGSLVILNPYLTHRLPHLWENPEGFDPDRFLPERAEQQPRFAYFPFGGGPRQCIGNAFALLEGAIFLATIAQRFKPELPPGHRVEPEPSITLRPLGGLPMRLVLR